MNSEEDFNDGAFLSVLAIVFIVGFITGALVFV